MAARKKKPQAKSESTEMQKQDAKQSEAVSEKKEEPKPEPKKAEPKKAPELPIEQVAQKHGRNMKPRFQFHHLGGLMAFCKSSGLPTKGSEQEMLEVLKRYGYKI